MVAALAAHSRAQALVSVIAPGEAAKSLQGFSELIKRVALLRGIQPDAEVVVEYHRPEQ